jgi:hypothetical protein
MFYWLLLTVWLASFLCLTGFCSVPHWLLLTVWSPAALASLAVSEQHQLVAMGSLWSTQQQCGKAVDTVQGVTSFLLADEAVLDIVVHGDYLIQAGARLGVQQSST